MLLDLNTILILLQQVEKALNGCILLVSLFGFQNTVVCVEEELFLVRREDGVRELNKPHFVRTKNIAQEYK